MQTIFILIYTNNYTKQTFFKNIYEHILCTVINIKEFVRWKRLHMRASRSFRRMCKINTPSAPKKYSKTGQCKPASKRLLPAPECEGRATCVSHQPCTTSSHSKPKMSNSEPSTSFHSVMEKQTPGNVKFKPGILTSSPPAASHVTWNVPLLDTTHKQPMLQTHKIHKMTFNSFEPLFALTCLQGVGGGAYRDWQDCMLHGVVWGASRFSRLQWLSFTSAMVLFTIFTQETTVFLSPDKTKQYNGRSRSLIRSNWRVRLLPFSLPNWTVHKKRKYPTAVHP